MKSEWQTKTLGNVCRFIDYRGRTPEKTDSGLRLITAKNVKMGFLQKEPFEYVKPDSYDGWMTRGIPQKGDVLFTTEAPLANVAQLDTDEKVVFAQRIIILQPKGHDLDRTFLKYLILSDAAQNRIREKGTGATVQGIKASLLKTIEISFPPLPEQQRIVTILDEAFDGIASAKANAEKNLQNARDLFESHLQSVFTQRGEGWVEKRLGELSKINYGYTESASSEVIGPKFLRITDIQNNRVDWSGVPYCPIEPIDSAKYKLSDGDIVFARTGASTGKSYLVSNPPEAVFASYLIRVQLNAKDLLPAFVNLFFQTQSYWECIRSGISGSAQGGFNATKLGELSIPFPTSPKDQQGIISKLDVLSAETQHLESIYQQKLAALDALKKSLLHQAFTGAL